MLLLRLCVQLADVHAMQEENGKLKASNDDLTVRLQEVGGQADAERNGPDLKVSIKIIPPLRKDVA